MKLTSLPRRRFALFLATLAIACATLGAIMPIDAAVALAFDVPATIFVLSVVPLWARGSPAAMRSRAARDDGGRVLLFILSAILLLVGLIALGLVVGRQHNLDGEDLGLVIFTLMFIWSFANVWSRWRDIERQLPILRAKQQSARAQS